MPTLTNQTAAPALRGENAVVTLTWTDAIANMSKFAVGQKAGVVSSGKIGYISSIDLAGLTLQVDPAQPDGQFDSLSSPGILAANESITFF